MITGWYGTETVGDKAILGSVIQYYKNLYKDCSLIISSIYPFITKRTIKELNVEAEIVATNSYDFLIKCASSDEIVMGGGPLMSIDALSIPLWAFKVGKKIQ